MPFDCLNNQIPSDFRVRSTMFLFRLLFLSIFLWCCGLKLVKEAASEGAKFLCFPESFSYVTLNDGESLTIAQPLDGPIMQQYQSLARESKIWLSLGGFQEIGSDDTHLCNTHVVIDDAGIIRSKYRKIHLFDVDVPGGRSYNESTFTEADMSSGEKTLW